MEKESGERVFTIIKLVLSGILLAFAYFLNVQYSVKVVILVSAAIISGYGIALKSFKNFVRGEFFDENTLMLIAAVTAFIIGEGAEGVVVVVLYGLGEMLEDFAVDRSKEKIAGLASLKCFKANLMVEDGIKEVEPSQVVVGSLILVRKGDKVPIDGVIVKGSADFDLKALTGESKLYGRSEGDKIYSGAINLGDAVVVKTEKPYKDSTVEKIIEMVENSAQRKAKSQKFITSFAKIYTPCVVVLAVLLAIVPPLFDGNDFVKWIYKALSFLIVSCPCALVISVPLCFFMGIGALAKRGILVKGGNYIDALSMVKVAVFDKTGTLTTGDFVVGEIIAFNGYSKKEILKIAASVEQGSSHPISKALISATVKDLYRVENVKEISGQGVCGEIDGTKYAVGNIKTLNSVQGVQRSSNENNLVYLSRDGVLIGEIELKDQIKEESKRLIDDLHHLKVYETVILSGDKKSVVESVATIIGADKVFSELLPREKTKKIEEIAKCGGKGKILYCGDGINDAPSVAAADVGVAMGALGSEVTVECADMVISDDNLLKIPYAIKRAKMIKRKVFINITTSILVKVAIMALSVFTPMPIYIAMLGDVGVMILAVLNSLSIGLYK
ncbi:MAG: cadmium-translocating P-type ATPase [Clostridia bacterium]|nr:cadmium-translocating P-type ATPase [Clostridia bacterium]